MYHPALYTSLGGPVDLDAFSGHALASEWQVPTRDASAGAAQPKGPELHLTELQALQELGRATVKVAQEMELTGLVKGTEANGSCLGESGRFALISPTEVNCRELDVTQLAELQWRAESIGTPCILDEEKMVRVVHKFANYGQPHKIAEDPVDPN